MPGPRLPRSELVLPPLSPVLVGRPYAAVPHLAAYARQRGSTGIRQRDLNQAYVGSVLRTMPAAAAPVPPAGDLGARVDEAVVGAVLAEVQRSPGDVELLAAAARDPGVQQRLL